MTAIERVNPTLGLWVEREVPDQFGIRRRKEYEVADRADLPDVAWDTPIGAEVAVERTGGAQPYSIGRVTGYRDDGGTREVYVHITGSTLSHYCGGQARRRFNLDRTTH